MATSRGHDLTEYFDDAATLSTKIKKLADLVRQSKHFLIFTGAGISTSSGIPDFRGPNGVWTNKDKGLPAPKSISMEAAFPTKAHMAIVEMIKQGTVKYVVSQNVDGLHRRSGVPPDQLSELHGNCYLEKCWDCGSEYLRDYDVSERVNGSNCKDCLRRVPYFCHCTSRKCEKCGSVLKDSIIHFKENLPEKDLRLAFLNADKADLCLSIGSSLQVSPACNVPVRTKKNGGKFVILNLQSTGRDDYADFIIHGRCDEVMEMLMKELGHTIPRFHVKKNVIVGNEHWVVNSDGNQTHKFKLYVKSADGHYDISAFVESVTFHLSPKYTPRELKIDSPPFSVSGSGSQPFEVEVDLVMRGGHQMKVTHMLDLTKNDSHKNYQLEFTN